MITDTVSIKNTNPITRNNISCLVSIAILPKDAPRAREPVSPIKILAGWWLYDRKPNNEPTRAKQNNEISL